jgi:hypothetical protein
MTKSGKALKEQYQMEALAQWKGKPLSSPVAADITLFFGTQRAADLELPQALLRRIVGYRV